MGSSSMPLVLYLFVKSSVQDTRQKVYENLDVSPSFPGFDFRIVRLVDPQAVFDDMLDLFLQKLSDADVERLQCIIVNGFGHNPTGALGDTEFGGAFFKMVLLAMLRRRRSNSTQRVAVVCAQSYSHTFTQQADSVPASASVFQFIPLTTSYQPYQVKADSMPKPAGVTFDVQKLVSHVLQPPNGNVFQRHNEAMLGVSSIVRSDRF